MCNIIYEERFEFMFLWAGGAVNNRAEHVGCVCYDRKLLQVTERKSWSSWKQQVSQLWYQRERWWLWIWLWKDMVYVLLNTPID